MSTTPKNFPPEKFRVSTTQRYTKKSQDGIGWVGLGGTTGTGQINDHARSKNSSLAGNITF